MHSTPNERSPSIGLRRRARTPTLQTICDVMQKLCRDDQDYAVACRLLADDAASAPPAGGGMGARLERAVARTTMELWVSGMATPEDVASAYAAVVLKLQEEVRQ